MNNKIINATKWSMLAEITAKLAAPLVNLVLARLLSPNEFGIVASITIITSFADIFTDAGFQKFVIQHEFNNDNTLNQYSDVAFTSNTILSIIIYIIIFTFRHSLAVAIGCPEVSFGLAGAALTVLCTSFSSIAIARFRRDLDFKPLFYIRLGSSLIPLFITVPLAFLMKNYWALVIGTVAQQLFIAVLSIALSKYNPHLRLNKKMFQDMFGFSMWNLCESISFWFAGQANIFIVAGALNSYYLGLYKTGMSTINSYLAIITAAITPILFSTLSRVQNNKELYNKTFDKFQQTMALFVLPMGVGIYLYRYLVVQILLGSQWTEIADFMGLWAVMSSITITYSNTACEVYRSKGKPKVSFGLQMFYLIFFIPAIYLSANKSFVALCYAGCFIRLLPVVFDIIILKLKFGIKFMSILKNTYSQIIATGVMALCGFQLQMFSKTISWQFFSIGICIIVYTAVVYLFPNIRKEIEMIRRIYKNKARRLA